jgi:hypothetical protein
VPAGAFLATFPIWFHVEPGRSTVELRLGYSNPHNPVY